MRGFTKTGDLYVDSHYGSNSTGNGSKEQPYATLNHAYQQATTNQTIVCSGFFNERINATVSKTLNFIGDGLALISGQGIVDNINEPNAAMFPSNSFSSIEDIIFYSFNKSVVITLAPNKKLINCQFYDCVILRTHSYIYGNIFNNCHIRSYNSHTPVHYENNTFYKCFGDLCNPQDLNMKTIILNNHFEYCPLLKFNNAVPTLNSGNIIFDYNNIVGSLSDQPNSYWQSYGEGQYQQHGISSTTNQFNEDNNLIPLEDWYKYDFTLAAGAANLNAGKAGRHIGARNRGYKLSADTLWTNRNTGTVVNLDYNATSGVIERPNPLLEGEMETNELDLGAVFTTDRLNLFRQLIDPLSSSLVLVGRIDYETDTPPDPLKNQKITHDLEIQYGTTSGVLSGWQKMEIDRIAETDSGGHGNADASFDPQTASRLSLRYLKLRFKLKS